MATIPTTVAAWIEQAGTFHAQKMCILALKGGRLPFSSYSSTSQTTSNPNTMDIDAITLSKLTPTKEPNASMKESSFVTNFLDTTPPSARKTKALTCHIPNST